jgi:hypothetical protein
VPGQESARGHDPVQPKTPGQQPGQRGDHGPVSPVRSRAGHLTMQHGDLVTEDQYLHVLGGIASHQQRQPAEHPNHGQVDQTDEHKSRA